MNKNKIIIIAVWYTIIILLYARQTALMPHNNNRDLPILKSWFFWFM